MQLPIHQIDAFAEHAFTGNPAAVVELPHWLPDATLQAIAAENNLSETAFLVREVPVEATDSIEMGPAYHLRWFTPAEEVDLCGHATLASAHLLLTGEHAGAELVKFWTRSGWLVVHAPAVSRTPDAPGAYRMDLPTDHIRPLPTPEGLAEALGTSVLETWQGQRDLLCVVSDAATLQALTPHLDALRRLGRPVIVTAPGDGGVDFVSRFFAPTLGVPEDPVTGSAHTTLTPYWAERLARTELTAHQLSARRGILHCALRADRVEVSGSAVTYLSGRIEVPIDPA